MDRPVPGAIMVVVMIVTLWSSGTAASSALDDPGGAWEIPILPYLSPQALIALYTPLRLDLEAAWQRPVRLTTARDYGSFLRDLACRSYPLVINAPHFARLLETDFGYRSILQPSGALHPVLAVREHSPIHRLADLRGRRIATPDPLSLIAIAGRGLIAEAGLHPGTDVAWSDAGSHNNALARLAYDTIIDAALISDRVWARRLSVPAPGLRRLELGPVDLSCPSLVYQTGPGLDAAASATLKRRLLRFANRTPAGRAMLRAAHHEPLRPVADEDRRQLEPYQAILREQLAAAASPWPSSPGIDRPDGFCAPDWIPAPGTRE